MYQRDSKSSGHHNKLLRSLTIDLAMCGHSFESNYNPLKIDTKTIYSAKLPVIVTFNNFQQVA